MEARVGVSSHGGGLAEEGPTSKFIQKKHIHQKTQIGTVPHLLAGGIAGAFGKTCTAPFARLTILFQVSFLNFTFFTFLLLFFSCLNSILCVEFASLLDIWVNFRLIIIVLCVIV